MKDFFEITAPVFVFALVFTAVALLVPWPQADAQVNAIQFDTELQKLDSKATLGLLGTNNSLAYRVHEIEKHFHNRERWIGESADQTVAGDWASDSISRVFQAISGADTYGADHTGDEDNIDEASVLNTGDSPIISGMVKYDLHRILVVGVSEDTPYKLRIVYGSGTRAQAVIDGQYSEVLLMADKTNPQQASGTPVDIIMPRGTCGTTKIWIEAWNVTDNATIDFLVGLHEYAG